MTNAIRTKTKVMRAGEKMPRSPAFDVWSTCHS
jgi:hypothetical protein